MVQTEEMNIRPICPKKCTSMTELQSLSCTEQTTPLWCPDWAPFSPNHNHFIEQLPSMRLSQGAKNTLTHSRTPSLSHISYIDVRLCVRNVVVSLLCMERWAANMNSVKKSEFPATPVDSWGFQRRPRSIKTGSSFTQLSSCTNVAG